jgi:hypothetical protein
MMSWGSSGRCQRNAVPELGLRPGGALWLRRFEQNRMSIDLALFRPGPLQYDQGILARTNCELGSSVVSIAWKIDV